MVVLNGRIVTETGVTSGQILQQQMGHTEGKSGDVEDRKEDLLHVYSRGDAAPGGPLPMVVTLAGGDSGMLLAKTWMSPTTSLPCEAVRSITFFFLISSIEV